MLASDDDGDDKNLLLRLGEDAMDVDARENKKPPPQLPVNTVAKSHPDTGVVAIGRSDGHLATVIFDNEVRPNPRSRIAHWRDETKQSIVQAFSAHVDPLSNEWVDPAVRAVCWVTDRSYVACSGHQFCVVKLSRFHGVVQVHTRTWRIGPTVSCAMTDMTLSPVQPDRVAVCSADGVHWSTLEQPAKLFTSLLTSPSAYHVRCVASDPSVADVVFCGSNAGDVFVLDNRQRSTACAPIRAYDGRNQPMLCLGLHATEPCLLLGRTASLELVWDARNLRLPLRVTTATHRIRSEPQTSRLRPGLDLHNRYDAFDRWTASQETAQTWVYTVLDDEGNLYDDSHEPWYGVHTLGRREWFALTPYRLWYFDASSADNPFRDHTPDTY